MSIVGDVLFGSSTFGKFFLGSTLGKNSRPPSFKKLTFQKYNFRVSRLGPLGTSGLSELWITSSAGGSEVGTGISKAGSGGG